MIVNKGMRNEVEEFRKIGVFDTLGYKQYENSQELSNLFDAELDEVPILFSKKKG